MPEAPRLYNATVYPLAEELQSAFPQLKEREPLWTEVEAVYRAAVHGRYEADLAVAYLHSAQATRPSRRVEAGRISYPAGKQPSTNASPAPGLSPPWSFRGRCRSQSSPCLFAIPRAMPS